MELPLSVERENAKISPQRPQIQSERLAMLLEPDRTQFDLSWRMFGTPVRVHPMFWLMAAVLGWRWGRELGMEYLLLWIVCVFVSVLLHEFGHVWMGRAFGSRGDIILYSFGGLAIGSSDQPFRWQRVLVFLAGPGIQLTIFAGLWAFTRYGPVEWLIRIPQPVLLGIGMLMIINLWWPLFNLLPIWPLDGGKVSREVFEAVNPSNGLRYALGLSLIVAATFAVLILAGEYNMHSIPYLRGMFNAILFALLAYESYILLSHVANRSPWDRDF